MATQEQIQLSGYIKHTHQNLRSNCKMFGVDSAWNLHCKDVEGLQRYAVAMHTLATKYWDANSKNAISLAKSRIEWVYNFCTMYFFNDEVLYYRNRECAIAAKINLHLQFDLPKTGSRLKLLDVGSCYNAFKIYDCLEVLPLDIAPATNDVFQCDFLKLNIADECVTISNTSQIVELQKCTFDVVVFSLLLEYLPSSEQRYLCCCNAYKLLKPEGVLIVITPDSKHVGSNAKIMKSWRFHLAKLGFSRIKYEKLPYIHCMAFRKSLNVKIASRWAVLQNDQTFFDTFVIPQDFNSSRIEHVPTDQYDPELCVSLFSELPRL